MKAKNEEELQNLLKIKIIKNTNKLSKAKEFLENIYIRRKRCFCFQIQIVLKDIIF